MDIRQHANVLLSQGPVLLSIWRPQLRDTPDGPELRAVEVVAHEVGSILVTPCVMSCRSYLVFCDDEGSAVDHPGLRLRLGDFTYKELAQKEMGDLGYNSVKI
ncbi:hypothetical protein PENSUB_1270 [Penicillium subrubescens]|uniref:Uncharacterized protein n=1 Tax=Penicillium subrubescens TaxID=1316194 RepID=A0A1Q5UL26_9EURO|nr:hypothetical protein PENSUB_1270 [Penicillium subrubescens]